MRNSSFFKKLTPYLMIAPAMIGIFTFLIYPIIYLVYLSFFKINLLDTSVKKFVGTQNFSQLFARSDFQKTLSNTFLYSAGYVSITMLFAILIAVWIFRQGAMNRILQLGVFIPHIISLVSVSLIWLWLMNPDFGLLNFLLESIKLPTSNWLQSSNTALLSIILVAVWQAVGYYILIIVAGLQSVPNDLFEAANLDNAGRFKTLRKIIIPMISPQLFFVLIILTINSFKVFDLIKIMTEGGPGNATNTLVYFIYQYRSVNLGFTSAAGVVLLIGVALVTVVYFRLLSKNVHYQ